MHLLRQLNTVVDEAAVTRHLLGQPNNVHDDQTAVISHLLDSNTRTLDYMMSLDYRARWFRDHCLDSKWWQKRTRLVTVWFPLPHKQRKIMAS